MSIVGRPIAGAACAAGAAGAAGQAARASDRVRRAAIGDGAAVCGNGVGVGFGAGCRARLHLGFRDGTGGVGLGGGGAIDCTPRARRPAPALSNCAVIACDFDRPLQRVRDACVMTTASNAT